MSMIELDKSAKKLVNRYKETYAYLLSILQSQIERGLSERHARSMLREIQSTLKELDEEAYKWSYDVLPEYYYLSIQGVDKDVARLNNINVIAGAEAVIHKQALKKAVNDLYMDLAKNTKYMEDEAKRIIRRNSEELLTRMIITGESQRKIKKELRDNLIEEGITSFVDAGRKRWDIVHYADMAIRTKSRILHNDGTMNRLQEYQENYPSYSDYFDLVQISSHGASDWCRYYEDTVWSISGRSTEYPSVNQLPNGYSTLHPNCKHVFLPYMPALRSDGKLVKSQWLDKSVNELNRLDYHLRKNVK